MKLPHTLLVLLALPAAGRAADIDFNRDVRPILSEHCFACHGFDAKARKAKLRLDVPEGAFAERNGVTPIKPGSLKDSEAWARITSDDPDLVMPPPSTKKALTAAQKGTLRAWIEQGAKYQKHWAFEPITRPPVPETRNSKLETRNSIDAFILARLDKEGLKPSPEADRETLIRRVAFALTGVPPTVAEVDAFLADKAPAAYERMVDRYLASPRFGEEMARHWLDVARYADTHGLHLDNERHMWGYRDWVVRAFNRNLPFDRFTVEQLAGDLLPNPTQDQLVATGFNRCNVTTSEGGSIPPEWVYRYAVDRTSTTMETWLGLTGGCCQCHDHKFDPISAKEFYSLYAFFYSAADPGMDGNVSNTMPFLKLATPAQLSATETAAKRVAETRRALEALAAAAAYRDPADAALGAAVAGNAVLAARKTRPVRVADVIFDDAFPLGAALRNTTRNAPDWVDNPAFGAQSGRRVLRQANGYFHEDTLTLALRVPVVPANAAVEVWVRPDPTRPPDSVAVAVNGKRVWWGTGDGEKSKYAGGGGTHKGKLPPPGAWTKLRVPAADFGLTAGQRVTTVSVQQIGGEVFWDALAVTGTAGDPTADPLASFRAWWRGIGARAPADLPGDLAAVATGGPDKKHAPEQAKKLRAFYLAHVARPATADLRKARDTWEAARAAHQSADAVPGTMIFRDLERPRESFVMLRGQYDKPGERVVPGVPAILPPLRKDEGGRVKDEQAALWITGGLFRNSPFILHPSALRRPTRLDLANWLVAPENPLTARVTVNRFWQQFFGTGLVKTSFDFGSQGDPPSHPELLDWLASEFVSPGKPTDGRPWDVKRFVKLLVTSATFRQQSRAAPEVRQRDPDNRLYARGPRFRLDAEQVRDNVLFASGLMNHRMGGPGVKPYQPPNIWEPVGYGDSNTRYYLQDHGDALYRRSLYTFLKRTAPPPFVTNFDGTNREQFCAVRDRTNTPLQALQLMNDVQHFEAARALAERVLADGGTTAADRITFLYRVVLSRKPDAEEVAVVSAALDAQLKHFRADPEAAAKAVRVGESKPRGVAPDADTAAWAMIANLVFNLDETVTRN